MTTIEKSLLISASAFAILAASAFAQPTQAGDWNNGASALKGSYASKIKPVPAPAPIPDYDAKYYIGVHGTFTASSSGTISADSTDLQLRSVSDTGNYLHGGFTVGRYLTPSIRAEISVDLRPVRGTGNAELTRVVSRNEEGASRNFGGLVGTEFQTISQSSTDFHAYNEDTTEITEYQYQTGMFNVYKDFSNGSIFTPFLGAGVGAVLYTFKRKRSTDTTCYQTTNSSLNPFTGQTVLDASVDQNGNPVCEDAPEIESTNGGETKTSWGFAVAGTAGVAVDITSDIKLDMAYRALYTSGSIDIRQMTNSGGTTNIKVEDRLDHELRLGVRWDIN